MAQLGFYLEAYGPVMSRMAGLLDGTLGYGRDVLRDGRALGRHCTTLNRTFFTPIISRILTEAGATTVLDLGCGAGTLLIDLSRADPRLRGVGLDSAPDAVAYALRQVEAAGLRDRISIVQADAFEPRTWPEPCLEADGVTAIGVMHELFRRGDQAVIDLFDSYARLFGPRLKTLVMGEPELYYDTRENDSEMFLAHIFTEQGIPRRRDLWLDLFAASSLRCRRVFDRPSAGPRLVFFDLVAR
jgi:cyclopropane fatty-acyl-phospholipid synthase-like methyltransferase